MADATQTQLDYRTLNIEKLTANLWEAVRRSNKNMLVLEPGSESGQNFMNVRVYFLKDWDGIEDPITLDERVVFDRNDFDLSLLKFVRLIMELGYEHKALMCGALNDIETPFIPEDGCDSLLKPRIVDWGDMSEAEYFRMYAALTGGINIKSKGTICS